MSSNKKEEWEPKIVAFICNWCTYAGADLAGTSRLLYQPNVRIIKIPCTGRMDPLFILKAFERGADAILVSGCHPGDCHYTAGNYHHRRKASLYRRLFEFLGIDPERLKFSWISASEGNKWQRLINELTNEVRQLGRFIRYQRINLDINRKLIEKKKRRSREDENAGASKLS